MGRNLKIAGHLEVFTHRRYEIRDASPVARNPKDPLKDWVGCVKLVVKSLQLLAWRSRSVLIRQLTL